MPALQINETTPVKVALTSGMFAQSGLGAFNGAQAVDGSTATAGWNTDASAAGSWARVDLVSIGAKALRLAHIFASAVYAGVYDVEFSDDAATWTNAAIGLAAPAGGWGTLQWGDVGAHRYWRLLLTNTPGAGGAITEIEFWERPALDVATLGFTLSEAPNWLDLPPRQTPSAPIIGRPGAKKLATAVEQPRRLTLRGTVRAATWAAARANVDALKLALAADPVSLTFADNPTRHANASLESFTAPVMPGSFVQEGLSVEAVLTAYDPLSYDNSMTSVLMPGGGTTPFIVPGSGPVRPIVRLSGVSVNPIISVYGSDLNQSSLLGSISITVTTAAGDTLDIDMDAKTVKKNGVSILSSINGGDFVTIEPADPRVKPLGFYVASNTGGGSVRYYRTWR